MLIRLICLTTLQSQGGCGKEENFLLQQAVRRLLLIIMMPTVLVVDDEKNTRDGLCAMLEDEFDVYCASDVAGALRVLKAESIDVLVTDLRLGGESGMDLIDKALAMAHPPAVIMMTAYGSVDAAVEAMRRGAFDFVTKPLDLEQLELRIKRAIHARAVEKENTDLRQHIDSKFGLESIIGESPAMVEVLDTIRQVAPSRATVLIEGESGTGKELAAKAIHTLSRRNQAKFVAVHCAALTPTLLESELFGHEKGAFTGATERRIGRFEQADGGTIFLDEIGEIDAATQVKLLRILGERTFERVGGNKQIEVDVRLVAATNKDLAKMAAEGSFREDLYHRINVVKVRMPPLRERPGDIPLLVQAFLRQFCAENDKPMLEFTADAVSAFINYHWPGNVRELRAAVEHGVVMARGSKITLRDLPATLRGIGQTASSTMRRNFAAKNDFTLRELETQAILKALDESGGNVSATCRKLGISRRTMYRRLDEMKAAGLLPERQRTH